MKLTDRGSHGGGLRVVDLFAGAGGFSLGFELAGCYIKGAIEQDLWASETFLANHPDATVLTGDIEALSDANILRAFGNTQTDIIVGFSVCRRGAGDSQDPRNSLFMEFVRACRLLSPRLIVMENVPNLLKASTASGEPVIDVIKGEFRKLGFHVYHKVLEATDFGVPQIRKRLFVIGCLDPIDFPFPVPTHAVTHGQRSMFDAIRPTPTLWDAISDLPKINSGEGAPTMPYSASATNEYQLRLRQGSSDLRNHTAMKHSARMVERFASMKSGQSVADVAVHLRPFARNSNGKISEKAYDQNNRRMHPDRPCHTVPAAFYANFVHPYAHRNFTPREGARIQSFPDRYVFCGKPTVVSQKLLAREGRFEEKHLCQYNQIGNAVPPLLAEAVALNLVDQVFQGGQINASAWEQLAPERAAYREIQRQEMQESSR